jgi:hypothetical protein
MRANGAAGTPSGAGGRVSVYAGSRAGFTGLTQAKSGGGTQSSGAGTVYFRDNLQVYGNLIVDNGGAIAKTASTPLRSVGRRAITGVSGSSTSGVWTITVSGTPWIPKNSTLDWGLDGLFVDLDASDNAGTLYQIVNNTNNSVTINTTDNLTALNLIGKNLVGVQKLQTLKVSAGASLDIGDDRLEVLDVANSSVASNSSIKAGSLDGAFLQLVANGGGALTLTQATTVTATTLTNAASTTRISAPSLTVNGNFTLNNSKITLNLTNGLTVNGNLTLATASSITTISAITVSNGNLTLSGGSSMTIPTATSTTPYKINLTVGGTMSVDATSSIDVSNKGYAPGNSGPDGVSNTSTCHGGSTATGDCSYGLYKRARFAGSSAGSTGNGVSGGGIVEISATNVLLYGSIKANGEDRTQSGTSTAAGGSVHIDATTFGGTGAIEAKGGANGDSSYGGGGGGAGGRISVYVPLLANYSYTGRLQASSGAAPGADRLGAGTVYVKAADQTYGDLTINNFSQATEANTTPIRNVGLNNITAVAETPVGSGIWKITVAGAPWKATNTTLDWGIQGIEVDLDASEFVSKQYTIASNTTNTITINTTDNLAALNLVNKQLVGVHRFRKLSVTNGASVNFGDDRIIVDDANNFTIDSTSKVGSGQLVFPGNLSLVNKTLSLGNTDQVYILGGNLTLSSGSKLTVDPAYGTASDALGLHLNVVGDISIDATSGIDVSGKGYAIGFYGPDGTSATKGCHGGSADTPDCSYGKYQRARFAGSAGDAAVPGGGLVDITATNLLLNGYIRANGVDNNGSLATSAGGSVHINVTTLSGTGTIEAKGGANADGAFGNSSPGAGGRISIYVPTRSNYTFGNLGTLRASSGPATVNPSYRGAGTVYVKAADEVYGDLIINNFGQATRANTTPIRNVGLNNITAVAETPVGSGIWKITVAGAPWKATNTTLDWGIQGIEVDLDASEFVSKQYTIASNTTNTITINTTDNLAALNLVNKQLVGVHRFRTLSVINGASATFNGDRTLTGQ